jgi:hypothetical protein
MNWLSRHLAGALVEPQLMTSCPTLCHDQVQPTFDAAAKLKCLDNFHKIKYHEDSF